MSPDGLSQQPRNLQPSDKLGPSELRTAKCYYCYNYDVMGICHHCGRFVCSKCMKVPGGWLSVDNVFVYLKPSLGRKLKRAVHCRDCFHQDLQLKWSLLALAAVFGLYLILAWSDLGWFQKMLLTGLAVCFGLTSQLIDYLRLRRVTYPLGFPLFSRLKVEIREQIEANFHIDDQPYLMPLPTATGYILVSLGVTPNDLERQESIPSSGFPLQFHAGFIALDTLKNVEFAKRVGLRKLRENLLLLTKEIDQTVFENCCRNSQIFYLIEPYRIRSEALQIGLPHNSDFPLFIKPRRADGGYRLEIIFELPVDLKLKFANTGKKGEERGLAGKPLLNSLMLSIPVGNEVVRTDGHYDQQNRMVRWYRNTLDVKPAFSVFIEFQQIIANELEFYGHYSVTIKDWTISQLHLAPEPKVADKYLIRLANGLRVAPTSQEDKDLDWLAPTVEYNTTISGKLTFKTSYLLSQQVQMISPLLSEDAFSQEVRGSEKLLIAPTHYVMNAIINALVREKVFIKQVTETPGSVADTTEGCSLACYWKIWGKYYLEDGLRPINLYLVISGNEPQKDRLNCEGEFTLELSLRSYVEMSDQETPRQLQNKYEKFKEIIKIAAYRERQVTYQGWRTLAWQEEERYENELQNNCSELKDRVAVILTGGNNELQGYIFVQSNDADEDYSSLALDHLEPRWCSNLPKIEAENITWTDKWELLKQVDHRG